MANEDRQSEQFIREVDEELRRAQLKAIWDRFAPLIIGVCVLVVVLTAGYRGWMWWQAREAAQAGDRFMAALENLQGENRALGEAELAEIAEQGGGYAPLARLRLAGEMAAAGQKTEAIAAYESVSSDGSVSEPLRDAALIRAALLALDTGDLGGARERAAPLDQPGNPWRHAAREVLGMTAYQTGELEQAREYFSTIQQDAETPPDLWVRSGMMTALIDGQLAGPGEPPAAADSAATVQPAPVGQGPAELAVPEGEAPVMAPGAAGAFAPTEPQSEAQSSSEQGVAAEAPVAAPAAPALESASNGEPAAQPPQSQAQAPGSSAPALSDSLPSTQNPPQ